MVSHLTQLQTMHSYFEGHINNSIWSTFRPPLQVTERLFSLDGFNLSCFPPSLFTAYKWNVAVFECLMGGPHTRQFWTNWLPPIKKDSLRWFLRKSEVLRDNLKAFISFMKPLFLLKPTVSLKTCQHVSALSSGQHELIFSCNGKYSTNTEPEETLIFTKKPQTLEINNTGSLIIHVLLSLIANCATRNFCMLNPASLLS